METPQERAAAISAGFGGGDPERKFAAPELLEPPDGGLLGIAWLNRDLAWLFVLRVLRSISQGYLGIILPLYLVALGYGAVALGTLLGVSAIAAAGISTLTGVLADRFGRKNFLVIISVMMGLGAIGFAFARSFTWIVIFAAIGSIGRGGALAGGAWGPFYPAVQALVAERTTDYNRTRVFGAFSFVGVAAAAAGTLLAGLPSVLHRVAATPEIDTYRILFIFAGLLGIAMAFAVIPVHEDRAAARLAREVAASAAARSDAPALRLGMSRASWRLIIRFMITNATNGLAIGMLGPFVVYWFYRRFGVGAAELAEAFFVLNLVSAAPYLMAGRLALMLGSVRSIVVTRGISTVLLFMVVLMPTFFWAAVIYGVRAIFNMMSIPVRQSYLMGVIPPAERSSASGLSNFPSQVMSAVGPYIAGLFMEHLYLSLPLEFAAVMQALNTFLYWAFFRNVLPPEEMTGGGGG
ncbi:MAG TPA: MFS transporter [Candidatus Binataceae bacterium]|nr:MFS transporter [Candidatus Binataceae bacterium]